MYHVHRLLWLAAWCVWAYIGCGLLHSLPRNLGPVVCKLPLESLEEVVGFLGEEHRIIVFGPQPSQPYSVIDVPSGARGDVTMKELRRYSGPWFGTWQQGGQSLNRQSTRAMKERQVSSERWWTAFRLNLPEHWATLAIVDHLTGRVVWREWYRSDLWTSFESADESLLALSDGTVFQMPPRPNWPLLVLVQSILAAPLLLAAAAIRIRRRRISK